MSDNLQVARLLLSKGKISEAKVAYDVHILSIIKKDPNFDLNDFTSEYIDLIKRYYNLDITEKNPIYVKFDSAKESIQRKTENGEELTEAEDNVRKLIIYETEYLISWGKYSDNSIAGILNVDPEYLVWCVLNLDHFAIENKLFLQEALKRHREYVQALEVNLIKHLIVEKWGIDGDDDDDYDGPDDWDDGPGGYGYDSWDDMAFNEAFEGDIDAWNHYNQ